MLQRPGVQPRSLRRWQLAEADCENRISPAGLRCKSGNVGQRGGLPSPFSPCRPGPTPTPPAVSLSLSIKAFKRPRPNWPGHPLERASRSSCDVSLPSPHRARVHRYFTRKSNPPPRSFLPLPSRATRSPVHAAGREEMCEAPRLGYRAAGAGDAAAADVDVVTTGGRRRIPAHSSVLVSVRIRNDRFLYLGALLCSSANGLGSLV